MDEAKRLQLIVEAVAYCQRVKALGMPAAAYAKSLREPVHFLWERRVGSKIRAAAFRSRTSARIRFGNGKLIYDHAIPFRYLQHELLSLDRVSTETVKPVLDRYCHIVLVTKAEHQQLCAAGYGHTMPADWDGVDWMARYKAVGIELITNPAAAPRA